MEGRILASPPSLLLCKAFFFLGLPCLHNFPSPPPAATANPQWINARKAPFFREIVWVLHSICYRFPLRRRQLTKIYRRRKFACFFNFAASQPAAPGNLRKFISRFFTLLVFGKKSKLRSSFKAHSTTIFRRWTRRRKRRRQMKKFLLSRRGGADGMEVANNSFKKIRISR